MKSVKATRPNQETITDYINLIRTLGVIAAFEGDYFRRETRLLAAQYNDIISKERKANGLEPAVKRA